ncbi:UDP-2,3-diacylglucosamine diphosphatase [Aurantivibrio plasticivorans]
MGVDMISLIADLHLDAQRPHVTKAFYQFLEEKSQEPGALYILGDLFELWVGDDDDSPLALDVQHHLKLAAQQGLKIYFMPGNRDFLVGESFAKNSGTTLLSDPHILIHEGKKYLLAHGDAYCTADTAYQSFRQQARSPVWQNEILSKSLEERRALGRQIRLQSKTMNSRKPSDIMDVTDSAVVQDLIAHNTDILIHGHTHRPNTHKLLSDDGKKQFSRVVLGDWETSAWCVEINGSVELKSWLIDSD